jgi:hypothetical protein
LTESVRPRLAEHRSLPSGRPTLGTGELNPLAFDASLLIRQLLHLELPLLRYLRHLGR